MNSIKHIVETLPPVETLVQFAELAREVGVPLDLKGLPMPVYLHNKTMQVHGPQNSLRKLIFVAPVLVAAEQLAGEQETPAPKRYRVDVT